MRPDDATTEAARVMTVCNACRYCEQYCPAFQAMEQRPTFASADVNYLANLCHHCGECLYACQYAPPHEFAIDVPKTLARARVRSYEQYAWPAALGAAFRHHDTRTALGLAAVLVAVMLAAAWAVNGDALANPGAAADFYAVVPHAVMATLFGGVGLFVLVALAVGVVRCRRDLASAVGAAADGDAAPGAAASAPARRGGGLARSLRDVLTLRHLHPGGTDCVTALEVRRPWRRWCHHATFYGFALTFASTSVAALYHFAGMQAPYAYTSLPVLLGTAGGIGLTAGTAGMLALRRRRDPALAERSEESLDRAFIVMLLLTSVTGLLLLALRHHAIMGVLLIVHLGIVLALFLTLPYGKFVHGLYRTAALIKYRNDEDVGHRG